MPLHVPSEDLLGQRHRRVARALSRVFDRRQKYFPLHARHIERKQPAVLDDLPRDLILASGKFAERNLFPAANAVDQRKVGRGQQPQVLAVLFVDALDILGNHDADAGAHLGVRRLLAARSFAAPLAAHRADESAALHVAAADGRHVAAFQPKVRNLAQRLVKIEAVVRGSDFVGRNSSRSLGLFAGFFVSQGRSSPASCFLISSGSSVRKRMRPLQPNFVGPLFDLAFEERIDHVDLPELEIGTAGTDQLAGPQLL